MLLRAALLPQVVFRGKRRRERPAHARKLRQFVPTQEGQYVAKQRGVVQDFVHGGAARVVIEGERCREQRCLALRAWHADSVHAAPLRNVVGKQQARCRKRDWLSTKQPAFNKRAQAFF